MRSLSRSAIAIGVLVVAAACSSTPPAPKATAKAVTDPASPEYAVRQQMLEKLAGKKK
ncbi:MAG: hypothetical protein P4L46_17185 [Fimbriimonas sp.]|nr:hypothetical protein [Fimbriimonas sp.]